MIYARDVLTYVANAAGVKVTDLTGPCRRRPYTYYRFVAVWAIRQLCQHMSYPAIGRLMGGRDHTTVLHADRRAVEEMAKQPRLQQIAMDAIARFATSELEGLDHAIALASAELD
ncbi:helix-turn-helix domain-containing protein, partial [Pseudomonas syringae]|uniref:helix-turn-helix domain-containing protein n=1 Tax=Pseudomonas syringae TaxID=317 RepID=UPI0024B32E08